MITYLPPFNGYSKAPKINKEKKTLENQINQTHNK